MKKSVALLCLLNVAVVCGAQTHEMVSVSVPTHSVSGSLQNTAQTRKIIVLQKINLSPQAQTRLQAELQQAPITNPTITPTSTALDSASASHYQSNLLDKIPVLDQGQHGTCVTFATTAAFDALLYKSDYVSPLCLLELGDYLFQNSFTDSGWDGLDHFAVLLERIRANGLVGKAAQHRGDCGNILHYPLDDQNNTGTPIELNAYHLIGEPIDSFDDKTKQFSTVIYDPIGYVANLYQEYHFKNPDDILQKTKQAVANGQVCLLGASLVLKNNELIIPAKYHVNQDTWALTPDIINNAHNITLAGHALVITGFDDNASATDGFLNYRGLLSLRNSWGATAGDNGNFYMTYDYFRMFANEVVCLQKISAANSLSSRGVR